MSPLRAGVPENFGRWILKYRDTCLSSSRLFHGFLLEGAVQCLDDDQSDIFPHVILKQNRCQLPIHTLTAGTVWVWQSHRTVLVTMTVVKSSFDPWFLCFFSCGNKSEICDLGVSKIKDSLLQKIALKCGAEFTVVPSMAWCGFSGIPTVVTHK